MGEGSPQKHNFYLEINYAEQNACLKFLLDVFGEKVGVRGRLVALKSLSTIKKGIRPLNFQSNQPFLKFLRQRVL